MSEATYHENKIYLPKKVRETLRLVDGDVLHIEVVERGTAKLCVVRRNSATKGVLEKLANPPDMGKINGKLSRDEIYEDIT
ncbi:MAG: hypothetical protein LBI79_06080 [Nitrososphaerota archaeon]|jgi:bifunctional DNA-binding transcriptional regulator/antitoxin component of YhaV-PrlF toxin-antitoxin module|nr:hypothetical protein [Nitrososphaerota archaeon]